MRSILQVLVKMPRNLKYLIMIFADIITIIFSLWLSFTLKYGFLFNINRGSRDYVSFLNDILSTKYIFYDNYLIFFIAVFIAIPIFILLKLYKNVIRFIDYQSIVQIVKSIFIYSLILSLAVLLLDKLIFPRTILLINFLITVFIVISLRIILNRLFFYNELKNKIAKKRILIVGTDVSARNFATTTRFIKEYELFGFLANDLDLIGRDVMGYPVKSINNVQSYILKNKITDLIISHTNYDSSIRNHVLRLLRNMPVRVKILPDLSELVNKNLKIDDLNDFDDDELIDRDITTSNYLEENRFIENKNVMITGSGGSIGSEICRQIIKLKPNKIILYESNENSLYNINEDLNYLLDQLKIKTNNNKKETKTSIIPILGSVNDRKKLKDLFLKHELNIIFHSAAYKHVPLLEENIIEAIKNNIFGTLNLTIECINAKIEHFVLISSDKAVKSTNVMGATKRCCELIIQAFAATDIINFKPLGLKGLLNNTNFNIVRFGNVIGSSGSVVPLFKKQIKRGGPITITDEKVTRYLMSIKEAAQLVIQVVNIDNHLVKRNAKLFILDMGEPIKIYDLAKRMIQWSGLTIKNKDNTDGDIEIKIIGLRPGEKLHEELIFKESDVITMRNKIMKVSEKSLPFKKVEEYISQLIIQIEKNDIHGSNNILKNIVNGI